MADDDRKGRQNLYLRRQRPERQADVRRARRQEEVAFVGLADQLASGTLLLAATLAAIVALIVVGCLRGQLKQAAQQSAAGGYVREGSFRLDVNADHFLYESTTKRKIENNTQKK